MDRLLTTKQIFRLGSRKQSGLLLVHCSPCCLAASLLELLDSIADNRLTIESPRLVLGISVGNLVGYSLVTSIATIDWSHVIDDLINTSGCMLNLWSFCLVLGLLWCIMVLEDQHKSVVMNTLHFDCLLAERCKTHLWGNRICSILLHPQETDRSYWILYEVEVFLENLADGYLYILWIQT